MMIADTKFNLEYRIVIAQSATINEFICSQNEFKSLALSFSKIIVIYFLFHPVQFQLYVYYDYEICTVLFVIINVNLFLFFY